MFLHYWSVCFAPVFPDWTSVDPHEALVARSNWSYFHLEECSIQVEATECTGLCFQYYFMHTHVLLSYRA